ncbi:MAG: tRNA uridine-5-carboxymethylaminomethyl(34) synthesis GTPase MnmE [Spirochaetales bacterium]
MKDKTIVAISTPIGVGGISIVRLSGADALPIALTIINKNKLIERYMHLVKISTKNFIERGLVVYFKNPNSYTGEDVVEFQCHGGIVIANGIVDELLNNGASLAEEGEFTKRAFLNGKLSLEQAEGVIDMINAESEAQVRAGYNLLNGELYKKVVAMQQGLTDTLAQMEVALDYPEHDIEYKTLEQFNNDLTKVSAQIGELLLTAKTGKLVRNGINVSILGRPNVGKSSLMNALLNYDRAIVTSIAGTTRDTLEESYNYKGIKINLIDTAGIRQSNDEVEKLGIERAYKTLDYADIILAVFDGSEPLTKEDKENLNLIKNKRHIVVQNKTDLKNISLGLNEKVVGVSSLTKQGINELKETIYSEVIDKNIINSALLITNGRHEEALLKAQQSVREALNSLNNGMSLDVIALDIKAAWDTLGEITGETSNEQIIDAIFSKFCLGK